MNKTQICLCQEGLFHILIPHMGLRASFAVKAAWLYRDSSNNCLFDSFLCMSSPGTACAAPSSAIRANSSPPGAGRTFLEAEMETRGVWLLCCPQPALGAARPCPAAVARAGPPPWCSVLGIGWVMDQGNSQLSLSMESSALL